MNRIIAEQQQRNLKSRDRWELFASHRHEVTQHLVQKAQSDADRLCVLGAGNCNDLDLQQLVITFGEIHLVDLDSDALIAGIKQQNLTNCPKVYQYGGVDLAGIMEILSEWSDQVVPSEAEIVRCVQQALKFRGPDLPGSFNVVASVCLLTQLIDSVVQVLGCQHPRFFELILGIRLRHLHLLSQLTAPKGWSILITDIVSSDTAPNLISIPEMELPAKLMQLLNEHNFFHGVNPFAIGNVLKNDPSLASQLTQLTLSPPWRWNFGPRVYMVYAIQFQKL